jgi:hypothetical protein
MRPVGKVWTFGQRRLSRADVATYGRVSMASDQAIRTVVDRCHTGMVKLKLALGLTPRVWRAALDNALTGLALALIASGICALTAAIG